MQGHKLWEGRHQANVLQCMRHAVSTKQRLTCGSSVTDATALQCSCKQQCMLLVHGVPNPSLGSVSGRCMGALPGMHVGGVMWWRWTCWGPPLGAPPGLAQQASPGRQGRSRQGWPADRLELCCAVAVARLACWATWAGDGWLVAAGVAVALGNGDTGVGAGLPTDALKVQDLEPLPGLCACAALASGRAGASAAMEWAQSSPADAHAQPLRTSRARLETLRAPLQLTDVQGTHTFSLSNLMLGQYVTEPP